MSNEQCVKNVNLATINLSCN